jgi:O-antigen/teichoic acid export membrane protein
MRKLYAFGGMSTLSGILWQFFAQVDQLIVGKLLGKELLGIYSVAMSLATLPLTKVTSVIQPVALPAFARLQDDLPRVADTVRRSIRIMSVVAFPVFWGISCIAPEIVAVVLGEKWREAEIPLLLLPLVMPLRLVSGVVSPAVNGVGRVDVIVRNTATALTIMTLGFLVGSRWGVVGVCLAWVILFPLVMGFNFRRSLGVLSLKVSDLLAELVRPLIASALMYGAVAGMRLLVQGTLPPLVQLLVLVVSGAAVYALVTLATNRDALLELMRLARR